MMQPSISIIVRVYNEAYRVDGFLKYLSRQKYTDFEVVFMDGDSKDDTLNLLRSSEYTNLNLQVHSQRDDGIYDAMKLGITKAKGEWLYFMGADDQFANEDVLDNVHPYLKDGYDIVYGDCNWMQENIKEFGEWTANIFIKANINHQRIFYRKSLFEQYGSFNTKYKVAADHELNIRLFCNPEISKKYLPVTIANYHSGGFSAQKTDLAFWEDWDTIILKSFKPYLPKKVIYGSLGTIIRYQIAKKEYTKAFSLLWKHFKHTRSPGFILLMMQYFIKSKSRHAG